MRTKLGLGLLMAALLAALALPQTAQTPEALLGAALHQERVTGNLQAAIDGYRKVLAAKGVSRSVAAQAQYHIGVCYEKLGNQEARKAFESVVRNYADQKDLVTQAQAKLAALGSPASGSNPRLIDKDGGVIGPSLDGRFLLMETGTDEDLELRDLQTGQVRQVVKNTWGEAGVSPDDRQVAFLRCTKDDCQLRVVGADGSAERLLWQPDKGWGVSGVQWSPDGRRVIVTVWPGNKVARVVAVSAADGTATTLLEGKDFTVAQLSPDGKSVVYTRGGELWLSRLEDRSETLLFEGQYYIGSPRWTPDGSGVVFLSDRRSPGAKLDLWFLRTSGGKALGLPELVQNGLGEMVNGRATVYAEGPITRDGAYYFGRRSGVEMRQLLKTDFDPDTGKAVGEPSFVSRSGGISRCPSFSQDGRLLSYVSDAKSLLIQSVQSGNERVVPITPSPANLGCAAMFPDERSFLVKARHPQNGPGIFRVDAASGAWTSLKKPGEQQEVQGFLGGAISPDGRTIYNTRYPVAGDRTQLIARDIESGHERELTNWEKAGVFALSSDGKQLAITHASGKDLVIETLPAAGGAIREICRIQGFQASEVAWTPDGRFLIIAPHDLDMNTTPGARMYLRVSVSGGEPQPIGIAVSQDERVQFPSGFGILEVRPDGRQLVYTARGISGGEGGDWALENFLPKAAK